MSYSQHILQCTVFINCMVRAVIKNISIGIGIMFISGNSKKYLISAIGYFYIRYGKTDPALAAMVKYFQMSMLQHWYNS